MNFLSFEDLRARLGNRGRSTVYRDIKAGRLPHPFLLGGRSYWREDEIEVALQKLPERRARTA